MDRKEKQLVVTELSVRDRRLVQRLTSAVERISRSLDRDGGPGEGEVDDDATPVSFTRLKG